MSRKDHAGVAEDRETSFPPFSEYYRRRAGAPGVRKGERTRDLLKAAAARLLEKSGYRDLRVSDINEEAGVSNALFYIYFKNKTAITREILAEFLRRFEDGLHTPASVKTRYGSIFHSNLAYVREFASHPGLMRCLFQLSDEEPEFAQLWGDWNRRWIERVVRNLRESENTGAETPEEIVLKVLAVGCMVDGFLRILYVDTDRYARKLVAKALPANSQLAEFLSSLWYRAIFGRDPSVAERAATQVPAGRPVSRRRRAGRSGG